jgi:hypothetical protein
MMIPATARASAIRYIPLLVFALAAWSITVLLLWDGFTSVVVADSIAYVVAGVNLVESGSYTNAFGEPELWFPPVYPLAIGLLNLSGDVAPETAARVIAAGSALGILVLLVVPVGRLIGLVASASAVLFLLANPWFELLSVSALSQMPAAFLGFAAAVLWMCTPPERRSILQSLLLGFLCALAILTRPEYLLLLPVLLTIDWLLCRSAFRPLRHGSALLLMVLCLLPYMTYLQSHTGTLSFSNKGPVNLAQGRADFHGEARQRIDPETLDIALTSFPDDPVTEVQRLMWNGKRIRQIIAASYRLSTWLPLAALVALGLWTCLRDGRARLALGALAGLAYVPAVAYYAVGGSYLFGAIPFLAVPAGIGAAKLWRALMSSRWPGRVLAGFVLAWSLIAFVEGYSRWLRWHEPVDATQVGTLRSFALTMSASDMSDSCIVYAVEATFGHYAGCRRGRLTSDELPLVLRHIAHNTRPNETAYLLLEVRHRGSYHPTVQGLFDSPDYSLREVARRNGPAGAIVLLEVVGVSEQRVSLVSHVP